MLFISQYSCEWCAEKLAASKGKMLKRKKDIWCYNGASWKCCLPLFAINFTLLFCSFTRREYKERGGSSWTKWILSGCSKSLFCVKGQGLLARLTFLKWNKFQEEKLESMKKLSSRRLSIQGKQNEGEIIRIFQC